MEEVLIIGGGASGLMCAVLLAESGRKVTVLEKNDRVGTKLLATGNGKCNLTNVNLSVNDYNTNAARDVIEEFSPQKVVELFNKMGLLTKTDVEGRVYPYSESANTVLNVLISRLREYGAQTVCDCAVTALNYKNNKWIAVTSKGEFSADKVIFACGSNATTGHDSLKILKDLGHKVKAFSYAIAPLKCDCVKGASGVRAKVYATVYINGQAVMGEKGELLFKDNALSGILAFRLSSAIARNQNAKDCKVVIDFVPDLDESQLSEFIYRNCSAMSPLEGILHKALAFNVVATTPMDRSLIMSRKKAADLAKACKNFQVDILGVESKNHAQVACGGVAVGELDMKTMQSKLREGLYCVGECVDVDGLCGGFNLHWAWASAAAAYKDIITK